MQRDIWRTVAGLTGMALLAGMTPLADAQAADVPRTGLPAIVVPGTSTPPFLDGDLTDACWQEAAAITNFTVLRKTDETVPVKALLIHDGQWLYIGMDIPHPVPGDIKQTVFESDGSVQTDDSVEIFIDPGSDGAFYLHYTLNAANIRSDQLILADGTRDRQARMPWRSATRLTDTGWNAEMAFPLNLMVRETGLHRRANMKMCDWSRARINLCLNTVTPIYDAYGARMAEERRHAAWAPVVGGYHEPERFGRLEEIEPESAVRIFWPWLTDARPGVFEMRDGEPLYTLTAEIRNTAYQPGKVAVAVMDRPLADEAVERRQQVALGVNQQIDATVNIPLKVSGRRTALVRLEDAERGGTFETRLLDEQTMETVESFAAWLDRNYYTDEQSAGVVCRFRLSAKALQGQRVEITDETSRIVGQSDNLAPTSVVAVDLGMFSEGTHRIEIAWRDAAGDLLASRAVELVKHAPKPGCEVKLDQLNLVVLKDGHPFFPFGMIESDLTSEDDDYFRRMAEAGFNTVIWWARDWRTVPGEYRAWLEAAGRHGLMVIDAVQALKPMPMTNPFLRRNRGLEAHDPDRVYSEAESVAIVLEDFDYMRQTLEHAWAIGAEAPNLLAYYGVDEPNLGQRALNVAIQERSYLAFKAANPIVRS